MRKKESSGPPTIVDLFCGAGGLSEGFRQAGYRSVVANDFDAWAGATFDANHAKHGTKFVLGDITSPAVQEQIFDAVGRQEVDAVVGGPPCQAFSQVRNHHRIIEDPRNKLYRKFVSIVGKMRPKVFVMENVPGLQNLAGGIIREQILEDLRLEGEYQVESRVVDAADHGVPQTRLRVLFVGVRADLKHSPVFPISKRVIEQVGLERTEARVAAKRRGYLWEYRLRSAWGSRHGDARQGMLALEPELAEKLLDPDNTEFVTVEQALSDLVGLRPSEKLERRPSNEATAYQADPKSAYQRERRGQNVELYNADVPSIREDTIQRLAAIPPGGNFRDLPVPLCERYLSGKKWGPELGKPNLSRKYYFAYRKLHPEYFSWTLNTKADCVYHYSVPRALSVREFARLHSFDDDYVFLHGDRHSRYRQIGNAVPPLLAKAIADAVKPLVHASRTNDRSRVTASSTVPVAEAAS